MRDPWKSCQGVVHERAVFLQHIREGTGTRADPARPVSPQISLLRVALVDLEALPNGRPASGWLSAEPLELLAEDRTATGDFFLAHRLMHTGGLEDR